MDRYWLFSGEDYYSSGGMKDFKYSHDSLEFVKQHIDKLEYLQWAHIYDIHENKIILESKCKEILCHEDDSYIGYKFVWDEVKDILD